MIVFILSVLYLFYSSSVISIQHEELELSCAPHEALIQSRRSLYPSTWPVDHGDNARSKFVLEGGLPINVTSEDIKFMANEELDNAQWLYTAGKRFRLLCIYLYLWLFQNDIVLYNHLK